MITTDLMGGTVGTAIVVLPGWFVARACRVPQPLLAGFVGSAVALVTLVLALDALRVSLTLTTVGCAWAFLSAAAAWSCWRPRLRLRVPAADASVRWRENWPLLLPLVPTLAVVVYRAYAQPLFGVDTVFRWNYLAEQMLVRRTLGFYPPVTATDYEVYSWPDGIAPIVSTLYFWLYSIAGATRPALTTPLVVLQFGLLVLGAHALAGRMFSARAAFFACALVACSPVIAWATTMGQETGLTAIALSALLLYLPRTRREETSGTIVFAALAAGLGALAREYGLAFLLLGLGLCVARRLSPRACGLFAAIAAVSAIPWYARNWAHTGNPLVNLTIGNWFPVNEVHAWLNESFQAELGWARLPPEAPRLVAVNCCAALIGAVAGGVLHFRPARPLLVSAVVIVTLWVASVGYTAAGFIYSLRVLNPALVLAAVLGGAALARWKPDQRASRAAILGLTLFAADAALRTLTLPTNVFRVPPSEWLTVGRALHAYHERPIYRELVRVAGNERLLVLGPNALLTKQGARTVPLWSPEARFVFDSALSPPEIARRLRAANIGFVLLNTGKVNERFLARSAFFRDPAGALQPLWSDSDMVLLRVHVAPGP